MIRRYVKRLYADKSNWMLSRIPILCHNQRISLIRPQWYVDLDSLFKSKRVSRNERDQRDFLIYLLWESGRFVNRQIGSFLGISYSKVSRRISEIKRRIDKDRELESKYQALKAQIKLWPHTRRQNYDYLVICSFANLPYLRLLGNFCIRQRPEIFPQQGGFFFLMLFCNMDLWNDIYPQSGHT